MSDDKQKELKDALKAKVAELTFAEYQGDLKGFMGIVVNAKGEVQTMLAFNNTQAPHLYMTLGLLQRQIEDMMKANATPMQSRD